MSIKVQIWNDDGSLDSEIEVIHDGSEPDAIKEIREAIEMLFEVVVV